jgi:intracellular sulfur oxidation DsrE/DsrF family protein
MRKKIYLLTFSCILFIFATAQPSISDSLQKAKDSTLRAVMHEDSVKIEKEFTEKEKMEKLFSRIEYPFLKAGKFSGVIPVKDATEIPDPAIDYKLLFELTVNNPDSIAKEINIGLAEIVRVINLHFASGIPINRIIPVIVVHGMALDAISNNEAYQKKHKLDNPNIKTIEDLRKKTGAKFIACGQAMAFFEVKKEDLLPEIKISLTAQTVLSHYQLKGFVLFQIAGEK